MTLRPPGVAAPALVLAVLVVLTLGTAARAEVCDKERPGWSLSDGPVGPWDDLTLWALSPVGLALILLWVLALVWRGPWATLLVGLALTTVSAALMAVWYDQDAVTRAAQREGCLAAPWARVALMATASAALVWVTARARGRARKS
ncbi:MAG: hypothetical protein AAF761_02865 [Pseudomonadota bacterium]